MFDAVIVTGIYYITAIFTSVTYFFNRRVPNRDVASCSSPGTAYLIGIVVRLSQEYK